MKLEKAPQETYADIGGLDQQIQVGLRYLIHWELSIVLRAPDFEFLISRQSKINKL